jgi:hypothetical protein
MTRKLVAGLIILAAVAAPRLAAAQGFGIGPRLSFVRGDLTTNAPATRFIGGTMRMVAGPHTVYEISLDYRSFYNEDGTERTRETPLQASMLLFPIRSAFAPYVGGGLGIYSQVRDELGTGGAITATTTERKIGWHLGAGDEIRLARHASLFADYRFRFVKFGSSVDPGSEEITIPGSSIVPGLDHVHLSHQGSMWTSGVAFYF